MKQKNTQEKYKDWIIHQTKYFNHEKEKIEYKYYAEYQTNNNNNKNNFNILLYWLIPPIVGSFGMLSSKPLKESIRHSLTLTGLLYIIFILMYIYDVMTPKIDDESSTNYFKTKQGVKKYIDYLEEETK